MHAPLVLTFDINGNIVEKAQKRYKQLYYSQYPGWAEQRSDFYWKALCQVSQSLKEQSKHLWSQIIAVTVTCIRNSPVCVDQDGRPLRDVILWVDRREANGLVPIPLHAKLIFRAVNMLDAVNLHGKKHINF